MSPEEAVVIAVIVAVFVGLSLAFQKRHRRDEALIHKWAAEQGHTVLRIRGATSWFFRRRYFWPVVPILFYQVDVQDDKGRQFCVDIKTWARTDDIEVHRL